MARSVIVNISFSILMLATIITGCTAKQDFDRKGWNDGNGLDFPRRNLMVDDLLQKYQFKGMKYKSLVGLLHEPDGFIDSTHFYYQIILKMNALDTIRTKNLVFAWNKRDSIISDVKVTEKEYPKKDYSKK